MPLENPTIRKSNSPIWVVDNKGTDEFGEKKKYPVIDFRNLIEQTAVDRYPMSNISMILTTLRQAKYLTTLDWQSGSDHIYRTRRTGSKSI